MLNPIFWKKVQGQKHPGRWGIVEHQIPSIKVLFKTNAKSHKHPGVKLLSSESKTQLVNQRKQNSYRNIEPAYIYIYINTELLDGNKDGQMFNPPDDDHSNWIPLKVGCVLYLEKDHHRCQNLRLHLFIAATLFLAARNTELSRCLSRCRVHFSGAGVIFCFWPWGRYTCKTEPGDLPWWQGSWGQYGAHLGLTGPRWAPCWPHELFYLGFISWYGCFKKYAI